MLASVREEFKATQSGSVISDVITQLIKLSDKYWGVRMNKSDRRRNTLHCLQANVAVTKASITRLIYNLIALL